MVASWADWKRPGTGPEMSATLATVISESVMPVEFLKPSHDPAFTPPSAEVLPLPVGPLPLSPPLPPSPPDEPVPPVEPLSPPEDPVSPLLVPGSRVPMPPPRASVVTG